MMTNLHFNQLNAIGKRFAMLLTMLLVVGVGTVWGETYNFSNIPTTGWKTAGNTVSINGKSWTYSLSTYIGVNNSKIQIGSKNNPQIDTWTIQIPISSFGTNIKVTKVEITAYTTNTTATYDISVGGSSVKSGDLTTSSATYSSSTLNAKTGSIIVTLKGSDNSKAMYLSNISVTYEEAATCTTAPTVSAGSNSNVSTTSATVSCSGGITSLGSSGCSITSYGFVYGTSSNPTISNTKVQVGTSYTTTVSFSKSLSGLSASTTYYVRPYATNGYGTAYGTQTSFTTLELSKYTVTLKDDNSTLTQSTAGATITLPSRDGCDGYEFAGWTKSWSVAQTTWTTTAPTIIPTGSYTPTANESLYPVYTKTETTQGTPTTTSNTYTHTITAKTWSANGAQTLNNVSWTLTNDGNYYGYDGTKGQQVGSENNPAKSMTLTTSGFSSATKITTVRISTSGASSISGSVDVTVGSTAFKSGTATTKSLSSTNTEYEFTGSSSGNVTISWSQTSSKAIYFKAIAVDYQTTTGGGNTTTTYYISVPQCTTETVPLKTPDDLDATDITSTSAILSWTAVANADGYKVTINGKTIDTDSTTYTAKELTANTSYTWTVTALSDGTDYSDSKTASHTFTTLAAASDPYTVNFIAGSGTCATTSLTEASGGAGVTLPIATPSATCQSEGWTFAGWWTGSVAETTTSPGELLTAGSNYKPTTNCTFYAVYSYTEAGGGSDTVCFDFADIATEQNWESESNGHNDITISPINIYVDKGTSDYNGRWWSDNTWRIYKNNTITITSTEGEITNVTSNLSVSFSIDDGKATLTATDTYKFTQITVTYSGGGSTTYYHSTPSCVPTYSITYDFDGGTGHCSTESVVQGNTYTVCDEAPTKEGNTFLHWSDGVNTYNPSDVIATVTTDITLTAVWQPNTYTVTWSVNGATTEVTYEHGQALSEKQPADPTSAACDGEKEFVGWTANDEFTYHATTPPSDLFKTTTATVTADKTYYAVFATPPGTGGGGGGSETSIEDRLTRETTGITANTTTYSNWDEKTVTSSAIYAGNSAGGNDAIQLRSNSNSGIVTTTSGGKVTHVEVKWQSNTASGRTLEIYGRNVAYDDATDLYDANTRGTKLGSIIYGTSTELEITGDYEYIGLRSNDGAMYLTSVTITWSSAGGSSSYTDYTTICQEVTGIAISGSYPTTFVQYDSFSFAGGIVTATFENGSTQDVTSLATFSGYNMDEVGVQTVTVTYMGQTAKYEITINQSDRWRLTWNVSGKTNTGARPIYVQKGSAIGTLPVPEVPAACAGKTFMGWTTSNIVNSDGTGITYINEGTVPTDNTTYYAVFATVNNFCTQKPIDQIGSGSKVVIVAVASLTDDGGAGKAISSRATDDTYNLQGDDVAIYDQTINTPHSTCIWTITKSGEKYIFTQDGKYLNGIIDGSYSNLKYNSTSDSWSLSDAASGMAMTYNMKSTNASTEYVEWYNGKFTIHNEVNTNGAFDMQFFVTANADGNADITDYTTGCAEYTITYYGFHGGYSTSCSSDGTIVLPVNSLHTVPDCGDVVKDHTNLGREFLNVWMTQPHGGHTFKPGDTFILTQDTTLYAQWKMETTSDVTTLPTDIEDLAGTDIYVYGGTTLNIQPGTTTINSLTLKGGLQADGSYKMPTVWVPEGATLVRNSNKINLDLIVNAKTYYPFAVPFAAKNNANVEYLDPVLAAASTYGTHFAIKTYDGARRAEVGEDKTNNWVRVLREETLQPGVGYIITALTYPDKDTATIRIPMTVPKTWFQNGEQAVVGTTVRNTIAVTAHAGAAATEHQRHAGWNFVANPYLTSFAGGNVANDGGLDYINGELIIEGSYEYTDEEVPYVTVPAYDFAYYSQHKLSDVKLSPEWSFFVQVGTGGTMNFTTAGRQQAPASIAARNAEERPVKMDVDLILSDNHNSDQTGIIISDRYTDAYEIGRDLEKLFGSAYNLSVYTLMEDNTPLAFQALAIRSSMQVIPVGYRAPEQGEYTFRLNEATSSIDLLNEQYEQLVLVDYQTGELTNLLYTDYTFYSERTQSNSRFAIYAVPRQNAPTDLPNAIGSDEEVRKVIYNDHLYILRDGNVYNGMGQKM